MNSRFDTVALFAALARLLPRRAAAISPASL